MIRRLLYIILFLFYSFNLFAQQADSAIHSKKDTASIALKDSTPNIASAHFKSYTHITDSFLRVNKFVNIQQPPVSFVVEEKKISGKEFIFYSLCVVLIVFGLFKTFYSAYYNNLFRVFFNTSIRQNQLTDQLLQSRLPSFILNIFFTISLGFYLWLLLKNYKPLRLINNEWLLPVCIGGIASLYIIKFSVLKFVGWMSGLTQAMDRYVFVIFLVNKIIGIVLLPFTILLAFSYSPWANYIALFSLLTLGLLFLSRYLKAFSFLEYQFPVQPLHFIIYIVAMEVLPVIILYKALMDYII